MFPRLPEVLVEEIATFLCPRHRCKKNGADTKSIDNFSCISKSVQKIINESKVIKREWVLCSVKELLGKKLCSQHDAADYKKNKRLQDCIDRQQRFEFIHFDNLDDAKEAASYLYRKDLVTQTCCGGKGYRWNKKYDNIRWCVDEYM